MNTWIGLILLITFSILSYLVGRSALKNKPKARLIGVITYIIFSVALWVWGWDVKILPILGAGIVVFAFNIWQLLKTT